MTLYSFYHKVNCTDISTKISIEIEIENRTHTRKPHQSYLRNKILKKCKYNFFRTFYLHRSVPVKFTYQSVVKDKEFINIH